MSELGAAVRAQLDHPVIDGDGHVLELGPAVGKYLAQEGLDEEMLAGFNGPDLVGFGNGHQPVDQRRAWRDARSPWWGLPNTPYEYATAALPRLFHERLDEFGIDLVVVYTTAGLSALHIDDEGTRLATCRALNHYNADTFEGLADRMLPVGLVPLHTPDEGIVELDRVVELGFRTILVPAYVQRRRPGADAAGWDERAQRYAAWFDTYGIDSEHDYDPFWARCAELGIVVSTHSIGLGLGFRQSISRFMYNDVGHFSATAEAVCKSLFMGGVTHRFPTLRFALLEGGVGWACSLYADLYSRWEKRNADAVFQYDPREFDRDEFVALVARYGGAAIDADVVAAAGAGGSVLTGGSAPSGDPRDWEHFDEFAAAGIGDDDGFRERFVDHFWFGCEADDRSVKAAFDRSVNPAGARLNALFSSDIGHWDVPDPARVLGEAHEQVEHGWLSPEEFRDFTFTNAVRLYGADFFAGTVVEREARQALAARGARAVAR
jgi:predicted TIM-barrel fold metal-dependent hydrolase